MIIILMTLSTFFRVMSSKVRLCHHYPKANVMKVDLDDLHLVEGDVIDSAGGVKDRHSHLSPGGGIDQGNMVGTVRHEHSGVRDILWKKN